MPDSTMPTPPRQRVTYPYEFEATIDALKWYDYCQWAQSLITWDPVRERSVIIGLPCRRWGCQYCAPRKVARLAAMTAQAKPNRLLTLTVQPSRYESPRAAFDETRHCVPELFRSLRVKFGDIQYLKVTELHKSGFPHYHALVRSGFLPHKCVKARWNKLTGATIVDLRQVNGNFRTYYYLAKYLSKMHRLEWTDRHVSYSNEFFPPECKWQKQATNLESIERSKDHPFIHIMNAGYAGYITKLAPHKWLLPACNWQSANRADRTELGLPPETDTSVDFASTPSTLRTSIMKGLFNE